MPDSQDALRNYATELVDAVPTDRGRAEVERVQARANRPNQRRFRVVGLATAGLLLLANVALAEVADPAAPGDGLYSVDKAYEWMSDAIGLENDRTAERLDEAEVLGIRDDFSGALNLVARALHDDHIDSATQDILAAERSDAELRGPVLALIAQARQVAEAADAGDRHARADAMGAIARIAQGVAGSDGKATPDATDPDPSGPPETAPGPTDAPPDGPGNSGDPGAPDNPGNSGNGPPDDPGPPEDPGNSGNSGPPDDPGNSGNGPPDDPGPPEDPGNSGNSGPPDDPGSPEDPGNSGDTGNSPEPGPPDDPGDSGNSRGGRRSP